MKFLGYLPLYEEACAIDFRPNRSIYQRDTRLKWDTTNKIALVYVCEWDRNLQRCYRLRLVQ